ncbi:Endothelin-converting enzyme 1, partial [Schistosoma japonicum]
TGRANFLDEIIADNGALHASFKTYRQLLTQHVDPLGQDPNVSRRRDQSYFYGFAQTLCGHLSGEALEEYTRISPYPLRRERVNIPLSNSEEFAKAYRCALGSPMNPLQKCKVY